MPKFPYINPIKRKVELIMKKENPISLTAIDLFSHRGLLTIVMNLRIEKVLQQHTSTDANTINTRYLHISTTKVSSSIVELHRSVELLRVPF